MILETRDEEIKKRVVEKEREERKRGGEIEGGKEKREGEKEGERNDVDFVGRHRIS